MNSVDKHLNAENKAATLLAMRSAKKEVLFVVEGDTDVDVFCNALGLPRSNILSCDGKETLMLVYGMAPQKGIDAGSVFVRDRDHDTVRTSVSNDVLILVTNRYDIEMELLESRIFSRFMSEFIRRPLDDHQISYEFDKLCKAASCIGAIRLFSQQNGAALDFDDIKYSKFLNHKNMSVDIREMVRYIFAKSSKPLVKRDDVEAEIKKIINTRPPIDIVCGKDFIEILHVALSRHYGACPSGECSPNVLSRTIRISIVHEDLKIMPMYSHLKAHVSACGFAWTGLPL